jgi:hypothetical protein
MTSFRCIIISAFLDNWTRSANHKLQIFNDSRTFVYNMETSDEKLTVDVLF